MTVDMPHEEDETENRSVPASTDCLYFRQHTQPQPSKFRKEHSPTSDTFSVYWTGRILAEQEAWQAARFLRRLLASILTTLETACTVQLHRLRTRTLQLPDTHKEKKKKCMSPATCVRVPGRISVQITLFRTARKWTPHGE
jgi:hypothetical protein